MDKKPTILIIENSVSFTGAFKCALQQARFLSNTFRFVFVLPTRSTLAAQLEGEHFTVYRLPMLEIKKNVSALLQYMPRLITNARALHKIILKEEAAVLVMNDFYNMLGVAVKRISPRIRLVTLVRFLPDTIPAPLRKAWITLGQKASDKMIAVSAAVSKQLPVKSNTICLYDAVSFPEYLPAKTQFSGTGTTFLYLGNYIQGKGQDYAVQAFHLAWQQQPHLQLIFAGGDMGLEKNRLFKQQLQDYVLQHGLEAIVRFQPFATDIEALMKRADVVLNFSEAESFSMTVAEAGYYGLPVIATRCGGPEEIIAHGETGLLVENKNVPQMCEAMLKLANDITLQHNFGVKARTYVRKKFSMEKFISAYTQVYNELTHFAADPHGH